jgi:polyhydroxybutyrate depolymerase
MKKLFLLSTVILFSLNIAFAQIKEQLYHDYYKRTWLIHIPDNYSENKSYPLVIALHGGGGTGKQLMRSTKNRFNQLADQEDFIVVYPQGLKKSWNDNSKRETSGFARKENIDDVGFINKMITQLESKYNINSKAIFACGISNGGLMSQTLAIELPEKIKTIGMVAANFGEIQINESKNVTPFSILFIQGISDPVIPYNGGEIIAFKKSRGNVIGMDKSIAYMQNLNGNNLDPVISKIENNAFDFCISEHLVYPNLKNESLKIELIRVKNGGHTWPGANEAKFLKKIVGNTTQDFKACDALWEFFKSTIN